MDHDFEQIVNLMFPMNRFGIIINIRKLGYKSYPFICIILSIDQLDYLSFFLSFFLLNLFLYMSLYLYTCLSIYKPMIDG